MGTGISVQFLNIEGCIESVQAAIQAKKQAINDRIQEAGINVHAEVVQKWPVGTPESTHKKNYHGGRSRQSFQYKPGELSCSVGSDVYYTLYVEEGHNTRNHKSFVKGRHILTDAYLAERPKLIADLQEIARS